MANKSSSILFLTPFYGYSGSEVALYNLLHHWPNSLQKLSVAHFGRGELAALTKATIPVFNYNKYLKQQYTLGRKTLNFLFRCKQPINYKQKFLIEVIEKTNPNLIVLNTLIMSEHLSFLRSLSIPLVLYVHEMDWTFSHFRREQLIEMVLVPHWVVCCSEASMKGFTRLGRIEGINVVYPGVAYETIKIEKTKAELCRELDIPMNSIIIAMAGSIDRNKDPQLFIQTAVNLLKYNPSYYFLWIGGDKGSGDAYYAELAAKASGIDNQVLFTGHLSPDVYYNYLNAIDCFFLTSVYDSFPLVMLEAGYLQKPIVGFCSGGISEYIESSTGLIINRRDCKAAATRIHNYLSHVHLSFDPDKARVNALQYSAQQSAIRFMQTINQILCG